MKKIFFILPVVFFCALFIGSGIVQAADKSPFIPDCLSARSCDSIDVFVVLAIAVGRYIFSFVGAVALLFFVYGGIMMIISHGNKETVSKGTKAMSAAVIGLVVAFSGYAIISFLAKTVGLQSQFQLTYMENRKI